MMDAELDKFLIDKTLSITTVGDEDGVHSKTAIVVSDNTDTPIIRIQSYWCDATWRQRWMWIWSDLADEVERYKKEHP
jgi:hypothetical protein